jgi:hypothetical protein
MTPNTKAIRKIVSDRVKHKQPFDIGAVEYCMIHEREEYVRLVDNPSQIGLTLEQFLYLFGSKNKYQWPREKNTYEFHKNRIYEWCRIQDKKHGK